MVCGLRGIPYICSPLFQVKSKIYIGSRGHVIDLGCLGVYRELVDLIATDMYEKHVQNSKSHRGRGSTKKKNEQKK